MIVKTLPYPSNLASRYQAFCQLPGFALLQSSDTTRGRYDVLSAFPYDRIQMFRDTKALKAKIGDIQNSLPRAKDQGGMPFQGGAIGYVAYDLGAILHDCSLPHPYDSLADQPILDLGLYDWALIVDHHQHSVHLVVQDWHPAPTVLVDEIMTRWSQLDTEATSPFTLEEEFNALLSKEAYEKAFLRIQEALQQGRIYQANYTQPFQARFEGDPWQAYQSVIAANPVPYSAFLRQEKGAVLSFSPERFLTYDKGRLVASPIKGSQKRVSDPHEDAINRRALKQSEKDRAENVMIVDLIRNDMGRIAKPGTVCVNQLCELQSFTGVHHLVSDIEAYCRDTVTPWDAFLTCFPGGSITGAPKREAIRVISEVEPYARGIYCGSIGYFSAHGRFDTNIAIRTIQARQSQLYLVAGGGIVVDSTSEEEYEECYTKLNPILAALHP